MDTLIVPCAGKSSRYNGELPKFLIKNSLKNDFLMVTCSLMGLPLEKFNKIYLVVRREHEEKYQASKIILEDFQRFNIKLKNIEVTVIEDSSSAADTVRQCLIDNAFGGSIYIKDCDDYFTISDIGTNEICTVSLNDCGKIHASNKSYVSKNKDGLVLNIVEKQVISADFCCGLYSFENAKNFIDAYNHLSNITDDSEIYISHIIYRLMLEGHLFKIRNAKNFIDWGTQEDWDDYLRKGNAGIL